MKTLTLLTLAAVLIAPVSAKAPKPIPPNTSRKLVNAYDVKLFENLGDLSTKKPKTSLPIITLDKKKTGRGWTPNYQISKDGSTMCIRYMPKSEKRLEHGQPNIYISTIPFKGKLTSPPSILDDATAMEFDVKRYLPQKWQSVQVKSLGLKLRAYEDVASGGADNEITATEPFTFKTKAGKTYWIVVKTEGGYHKNKGMTLQKSLDALIFPK